MLSGIIRLLQAVVGLAILALGITLLIAAEAPDPWGVFLLALNLHLPLSLGVTAPLGGLILIAINWYWGRRRPGFATVLSMVLVGGFIDIFQAISRLGDGLDFVTRVITLVAGIVAMAFGIAVYVQAGLGEGPVEGMMFVVQKKLGVSVAVAKVLQDISFVAAGLLLGWPVQGGTFVSALCVGPATNGFLRLMEGINKKAPVAPK